VARRSASPEAAQDLAAAGVLFERSRRNKLVGLALFALSTLPSAQLFEAADLASPRSSAAGWTG
jgi:hypothetical protein